MAFQPIVNGLRIGSLVKVKGQPQRTGDEEEAPDTDGQLGQLVNYFRESDTVEVACINGVTGKFSSANVEAPKDLQKPGTGGDENSFDVLIGPATASDALGEEMADCLFEKGFCVLKICQSLTELEQSAEVMRSMGDSGLLGRLPQEVEEGYLGTGGRGKVTWMDPDSPDVQDAVIEQNDQNLSYLASLLQPFSADALGKIIDERTPALLSLSLQDDEVEDYPHPMASDKILGDYLGTWRHGAVRALHFMGPTEASVTLENKGGAAASALACAQESVLISAPANTIVLFRTDCFSYSAVAESEFFLMMASFLAQAPRFELTGFDGDIKALSALTEGPAPPPGNVVNIMDHTTKLACRWDSAEMMNTGLQAGTDTIVEIPITRFPVDVYFCPDPDEILIGPPRTVQRHTSFIDGVDLFDFQYFEISKNEATGMGPLQRQVLDVGGTLMHNQGMPKSYANRKSHHAGCSVGLDKDDFPFLPQPEGGSSVNALAIIANRFSFVFNMKGPNFITDTACSASLTAVHCAKLMIYDREWDPLDYFVTVGTHLCLAPGPWIGCSMSGMVSPQGRCFTFNASANGYLRGEGTSGLFMKYGVDIDDKDAILRSSQIAQDGRSASLTAPNGPAQEEMITRAIKEARMTPPESTCWECHGTGTSLGDPIEVGAVRKVQIKMTRPEPLMMSTAKSNIGHLEGGAAMAGMMKCVMQVMYGECFSTLHVRQLNPHLDHAAFEAFFETEATSFKFEQGHSQVSSLGFGGSNGHAIFWGRKVSGAALDPYQAIQKRMKKMPPPEVRVIGDNPDEWDADLPEADVKPGDKYKVYFSSDDPADTPLRWVKDTEDVEDDDDASFSITGSFNGWEEDRMAPGDVPGQFMTTVTLPSSGSVEFHFLKDGDASKLVCPQEPNCTRKTAPVLGPEAGVKYNWLVVGEPDTELQVELLYLQGKYSIVWFKA